ncbi:MAG: molecular chaperone DnaK [Armatimonadota bacterium]|nr:molecular chaperone DnaK [Armatimonadota bacterium]
MAKVVGIDLGTTNSCVAVVEAGDPKVIPNAEGGRTTPSVVGFSKDGERLVGQPAKRQAILNPDRTVASIKRQMGTREQHTIDGKDYSPEQISAMILRKLKDDAADYLGEDVPRAVITVPAYFDDNQRTATKQAGEIAGLEVMRIINEPTAAALAYGHQMQKLEGTIMVYDLGGGTFDVSIMDVEVDKANTEERDYFEVRSTAGDTHLGGDDFDQRIIDWMAEEFNRDVGIDLRKDRQALQRLKEAAEKAKCELSSAIQTQISLPFITSVEGEGPKHLEMTLTRAKFEELIADLVKKTAESLKRAMEDAGVEPGDLQDVILVGGSTRIPMVQNLVEELAGKPPRKGINPDEVVAIGAAIQAAVLGDEMQDMVLVDVTPLTLGIETLGDVFDGLIERNTSIPTKVQRTYTTASDNQSTVEVHVLQGERRRASQNKSLGRFHLTGIPPAPRGIPQIEVTFDIDANGILNVTAQDKATGREQDITITGSGQLSDDEVERMVHEAEEHAEEDQKFEELAQARNKADQLAHQIETALDDLPVSDSDKDAVRQKVEGMREAAKGDDAAAIEAAIDEAQDEFARVSQQAYEAAGAAAGGGGAQAGAGAGAGPGPQPGAGPESGAAAGGDEEVIDAEFEAEDEE